MNAYRNKILALLQLGMGWVLFYAGITKVLDPEWSAAGYLSNATTFNGFYSWLASSTMLPITNFLNQWGLTLIGAALILHFFVRWAALGGAVMMVLYYFPILEFPYAGTHSFVVDDHIIYALVLLLLATVSERTKWWERLKR